MDTNAARQCSGMTAAGKPCRRPPSRDSDYCLAHDPERTDEHAAISSAGGVARHDPETLALKDEVREIMASMRAGAVSAGVGSVLLQAIRLLRELEADDRQGADDGFIESIQALRASGGVPDLSESANAPPGGIDHIARTASEARERDEDERAERAQREREGISPLAGLTLEERRERRAGNRR